MINNSENPTNRRTSLFSRLVLLFRFLMLLFYYGAGTLLLFDVIQLVDPLRSMSWLFGAALIGYGVIRSLRFYKDWHYRDFNN